MELDNLPALSRDVRGLTYSYLPTNIILNRIKNVCRADRKALQTDFRSCKERHWKFKFSPSGSTRYQCSVEQMFAQTEYLFSLVNEVTIDVNSFCPSVIPIKPADKLALLLMTLPEKFNDKKLSINLTDVHMAVDKSAFFFKLEDFFRGIELNKPQLIFKSFRLTAQPEKAPPESSEAYLCRGLINNIREDTRGLFSMLRLCDRVILDECIFGMNAEN